MVENDSQRQRKLLYRINPTDILGDKSTLIHINLEKALFHEGTPEEFHVKIAETPQEMTELLEVGFEYVCEKDGLVFFRKRK